MGAAGYLIAKLLELVQATGGFGNALNALGNLSKAVWQAIIDSAAAIPPGLSAIWGSIKADFIGMLAELQARWATFLTGLSNTVQGNAALKGLFGDSLAGIAENAISQWEALAGAQADAEASAAASTAKTAGIIADAFAPVADAWANLKNTVEDGIVPPEVAVPGFDGDGAGGGGGGGSGGGGGAKSATQASAEKAAEALKALRQEHADLKATVGMTEAQERLYVATQSLGAGATAAQVAEVQRLIPEMDALAAAKERLAQVAQAGKAAMENLFGSVIDGSMSAKDAVANLIAQIARVQLMNGIMGMPGMGGASNFLGNLMAPKIPGFANGVTNFGGGMARINEYGRGELAIMPNGSTVIPHDLSKQMAQGNQEVHVHVTTSVDQNGNLQSFVDRRVSGGVQQGIKQFSKQIPDMVQRSVRNPRDRW